MEQINREPTHTLTLRCCYASRITLILWFEPFRRS